MNKFFRSTMLASAVSLAGCGPAYAPADAPAHACPGISAEEYSAAKAAGAASGTAKVKADGSVWVTTGPGVVHCATFKGSAMKPCRRPNDFVIRYEFADGSVQHVKVPKGETYRFNISRGPMHCEILDR